MSSPEESFDLGTGVCPSTSLSTDDRQATIAHTSVAGTQFLRVCKESSPADHVCTDV